MLRAVLTQRTTSSPHRTAPHRTPPHRRIRHRAQPRSTAVLLHARSSLSSLPCTPVRLLPLRLSGVPRFSPVRLFCAAPSILAPLSPYLCRSHIVREFEEWSKSPHGARRERRVSERASECVRAAANRWETDWQRPERRSPRCESRQDPARPQRGAVHHSSAACGRLVSPSPSRSRPLPPPTVLPRLSPALRLLWLILRRIAVSGGAMCGWSRCRCSLCLYIVLILTRRLSYTSCDTHCASTAPLIACIQHEGESCGQPSVSGA